MGDPCHRAVSIDALTHHLRAAVTAILFRAVAKMICCILELRAAAVRVTASQYQRTRGEHQALGIGMRLLKAKKAI